MSLQFFYEDTSFELENTPVIEVWIKQIINNYGFDLVDLNYIFCSDNYLLEINREHLNHDYYTDIITFDHSEENKKVESDIFISVDRVKENADSLSISFHQELYRVMAHGLLHLFGYSDKTSEEKIIMREKEDACISLQQK